MNSTERELKMTIKKMQMEMNKDKNDKCIEKLK